MRINAVRLIAVLIFVWSAAIGCATDIGGTISTTMTLMDNSRLVGDVTCTVSGAPCIVMGASGIVLDLNGYTISGLGDPQSGCSGSSVGSEIGILVNKFNNVTIRGLGIVKQFRNFGIQLLTSTDTTVTGVPDRYVLPVLKTSDRVGVPSGTSRT